MRLPILALCFLFFMITAFWLGCKALISLRSCPGAATKHVPREPELDHQEAGGLDQI